MTNDQHRGFQLIAPGRMDGAIAWVLVVSTITVLVSCHRVCFIGSEYDPQSGTPPRWFLSYNDPCECTAVRLGGMRIPASSYRQGAPRYLESLFLSEDLGEIRAFFGCKVIGVSGNTKTYVRRGKFGRGGSVFSVNSPNIVSENELRRFWLRYDHGTFALGKHEMTALFEFTDPKPLATPPRFYGIASFDNHQNWTVYYFC